jgi:hypothetical protein
MSFMDALENFKPTVADDVEIALPARREPKKEVAEAAGEPDLGQHGGAADGAQGAAADVVSGNAAAAAAAEPAPQRDDPDDGEHTDSNEQELAARARKAAARDTEGEEAPPAAESDVAPEPDDETTEYAVTPDASAAEEPVNLREALSKIEGTTPKAFKRIGFSSGEDTETLTVTRFPQPAVDKLRLMLAPSVGGEFAEAISTPALITAFMLAKTGLDLDVDANTAIAANAFRGFDPRLSQVEDKIDDMMSDVAQLASAMKLSLKRVSDTGHVVDGLEFSMAYLVADRVAGLTTADTDETNVDVTQKKVLVARENIRTRAKAQRTIEKQRAGRSNA